MPDHLHIVRPLPLYLPVIDTWVAEVEAVIGVDAAWGGWSLHWILMDRENGFKATDVLARILQNPGPVVIFDSAQRKPLEILRSRLLRRSVVCVVCPSDSTELWASMCDIKGRHESGEPLLPRKLVAAVLLVRKLYRGKYWGGTRNKNFMWTSDLAKGRGVPEEFQDIIQEVANDLFLSGLLIRKGGLPKVALNPKRRREIDDVRLRAHFFDGRLDQVLMRDRNLISARLLEVRPSGEPVEQSVGEEEEGVG